MAFEDSREEIITKRKYRSDIKGSRYSLYLSSYPIAIEYLSKRLKNRGKVLLELCCAVGVTLEGLSSIFDHLVGVELDPNVLEYCRQNLHESGILNKVELIQGDVSDTDLLKTIRADIVIYDIPYWWNNKQFPDGSEALDNNPDFGKLIEDITKYITKNIVVFAPFDFDYNLAKKSFSKIEYEKIYINDRHDRNYIYGGDLVQSEGVSKQFLYY